MAAPKKYSDELREPLRRLRYRNEARGALCLRPPTVAHYGRSDHVRAAG